MPLDDGGTSAPRMNCAQNNPNRANASRSEIERLTRMAPANTVWAAVSRISSRWAVSTGRPWRLPEAIANTSGRVPTSRVHWLVLEEDTAVGRSLGFHPQGDN